MDQAVVITLISIAAIKGSNAITGKMYIKIVADDMAKRDMDKSKKIDVKAILRWIAFLPAAGIAGFLAYNIVWYLQSITTWIFVGRGTILEIYFIRYFSHLCMGMATIYVACFVAPSSKKVIALVTSGLVLVFPGELLYFML
ncbi:MAG: hypothetical protein U5K69_20705 [Balneolaceae bacterium]|nr:hypothetical protein [Balneolaceae bacterium]